MAYTTPGGTLVHGPKGHWYTASPELEAELGAHQGGAQIAGGADLHGDLEGAIRGAGVGEAAGQPRSARGQ